MHGGDVLQKHRLIVSDTDHQVAQLFRSAQRDSRIDTHDGIRARELAGWQRDVRSSNRALHFQDTQVVCSQQVGIERDSHGARLAADNGRTGNLRQSGQPFDEFLADTPQRMAVLAGAGQRQCDDRHVVDLNRLDYPSSDAGRHAVLVLVQLLEEFDEAAFAILSDEEPHRDDRLILARLAVDILDAVDLIEHSLQRRRDQLLDFGRRVAGEVDVDVRHRHDDLRVFFPRCHQQRRPADDQ